MRYKGWMAGAVMLIICLLVSAAGATMHTEVENPALEMAVTVGYNGLMTYGKAFPIWVTIRNDGEDFEGSLGVNAYATEKSYDRYERKVTLPAGAERTYVLAPTVDLRQDTFTVELIRNGEVVRAVNGAATRTVNPSAMLIGVLSTRARRLNYLNIDRENDTLSRYELWQTVPLTVETFPEDFRLLNSFGMIVMDDIDPAELSPEQQSTLIRWVRSGRILICGGGAASTRAIEFFGEETGLAAEGLTESEDVINPLLKAIGRAERSEKTEAMVSLITGGDPLVADEAGRGLIWRTVVGAGRVYTAAFELGSPAMSSDALMHYFWQQLLVNQDGDLYSQAVYAGRDYGNDATAFAGYSVAVKARSGMKTGLLVIGAALALGVACWFLLKKSGKQRGMWLVLPALSAAAVACMAALSGASQVNRPMAVVTENMVQSDGSIIRSYRGIQAAAPEYGRHSYGMLGERLRVVEDDYYYYYDEDNNGQVKEPGTLRTCYMTGGENAVSAESGTPWKVIGISCEEDIDLSGSVEASIWMEEDGLHGEILNGTEQRLTGGKVVTSFGYASVADLAPGEKAEVWLKSAQPADPQNPQLVDGEAYLDSMSDFYSAASGAMGVSYEYEADRDANLRSIRMNMVTSAAYQLAREENGSAYVDSYAMPFVFTAEPESLPEIGLTVDGARVENLSSIGQLTVEMKYLEVGKTGVIFRMAGMDQPTRVEIGDDGLPGAEVKAVRGKGNYYALSESPAFRFDLSAMTMARLDSLRISMYSYYSSQCRVYALNAWTKAWDEIGLNENIRQPERYLDADGMFYIQFRPNNADMYAEVPLPMIVVKGVVDHDEN